MRPGGRNTARCRGLSRTRTRSISSRWASSASSGSCLIVGAILTGIVAGLRRALARAGEERLAIAAVWAGLVAYAFAAGIDWMWEMTVVSVVAFALLGLVTSSAAAGDDPKPLRRRWDVVGRVVLGVAGLFVILAQAVSLLTNREIQASQRAAGRDDLAAAVKRADNARRIEPWASSPYEQLALLAEKAQQFDDADALDREGDRPRSHRLAPVGRMGALRGRARRHRRRARTDPPRVRAEPALRPLREVLPVSTLRQSRMPLAGSILTGFLGQAVLIVSGVLAARILGVEDRGYLALLVLFPAVLAQIGSLGLPLAATFELSRDRSRWAEVVRTLVRPFTLQSISLVLLHAGILLAVFWSDPHAVRISALMSLCAVPAILGQSYGTATLQGQQRFLAFNVLRTLPAVAYTVAVLAVFVVGRQPAVGGRRLDRRVSRLGRGHGVGRGPSGSVAERSPLARGPALDAPLRDQGPARVDVAGRDLPARPGGRRPLPRPGGARPLRGRARVRQPPPLHRAERRLHRVPTRRRAEGGGGLARALAILLARLRRGRSGRSRARARSVVARSRRSSATSSRARSR